MEKLLRVEDTNKSELIKEFEQILEQKLKEFKQEKTVKLLNRKQVAQWFGVSTPTIDSWQSKNLITFYRKGNRKYAILSELIDSLTKINN